MQPGWSLRPRCDRNVSGAPAHCVEKPIIVETQQFDSRLSIGWGEGIEQPTRGVVEADGNSSPARLAAADPPSGQQRSFGFLFELRRARREVFARRREPQRPSARFGQPCLYSALGLGESVARGRWADVKRTRRIAKSSEFAQCGEELEVGAIERHMHIMHQ